MATIRFTKMTTSTPERFIAGLTDFGPGRAQLFPNSHDGYLKVHRQGAGFADVTEGSGGVWERLHYDWSDVHHIVLKTTDSNLWGGASGHTYDITELPDSSSQLDVTIVREGKNVKGHLVAAVFSLFGKRILGKAFEATVRAIETRNLPSPPTEV